MRPFRASLRVYLSGIGAEHTRHLAPARPSLAASEGPVVSALILNVTPSSERTGSSHTGAPLRLLSQKLLAKGAVARQAGLGQLTVRVQDQAIIASPLGTYGYRCPTSFQTASLTRWES